jgi:hypothetical protein
MSKPFKTDDLQTMLRDADCEIISAMSSLNMLPEPIEDIVPDHGWLSETDKWAEHAMEHLHQAHTLLSRKENQLWKTKNKIVTKLLSKTAYNAGTPLAVLEDKEWEELWQLIKEI